MFYDVFGGLFIGELTDQRNEFQDGMDEAIKKRNELKVENSDLKNELRDNEIKLLENQQKINELKGERWRNSEFVATHTFFLDQVAKNEFKHHSQFETLRRRNSELSLLLKSSENTQVPLFISQFQSRSYPYLF